MQKWSLTYFNKKIFPSEDIIVKQVSDFFYLKFAADIEPLGNLIYNKLVEGCSYPSYLIALNALDLAHKDYTEYTPEGRRIDYFVLSKKET